MSSKISLTYYDTAMILLEVDGLRILTDPVLDPAGSVFKAGPVSLEKTSPSTVSEEQLGEIDAVLLSHDQHGDNLDDGGRRLLGDVPRVITTPKAASRLGGSAEGLKDWQETELIGASGSVLRVTAVPAQHGPTGTNFISGPVTGFMLQTESGARIYISGDTVLFKGTEEIARRFAPVDLAVLHLGRVHLDPIGLIDFSLSAEKAIAFAKDLQAECIVPVHFEGWKHFSEGREAASAAFRDSSLADRTTWLKPRESIAFELASTTRAD